MPCAAQCGLHPRLGFALGVLVVMLLCHFVNPRPPASPIRLDNVGRCIYCGKDDGPLGAEHIIPESIGGALVLPKATCPCGPRQTHGFEGRAVTQIYQQIRRQMGIRGKKGKRPPGFDLLPLWEERGEPLEVGPPDILVAPEEHPSILAIPRINPLSLLGNDSQFFAASKEGQRMIIDMWDITPNGQERTDRIKAKGATGVFGRQKIEVSNLCRLLAKIAHASATSCLGFGGFRPLLLEAIAAPVSTVGLVGEMPATDPGFFPFDYPRGLHEIAIGFRDIGSVRYVIAEIRLFSNLFRYGNGPCFTPRYAVAAGTIP